MQRIFASTLTSAVSSVTHASKRLRASMGTLILLSAFATGCGGAIQFASEASGGSATSGDSLTDLDSLADDGAQDQCTLYDTSSPNRSTCIACYDSLVSSYCPDQTSIGDCVDTEFQEEFPSRLNQCILNSILAGFTCSITCDDDEDLDETSCSCVTRATQSTGLSAISQIDVGQFDSGPPVVTAYANTSTFTQTVLSTESCGFTGTDTNSVFLSVRNRGGTMFRDNTYSVQASYDNAADVEVGFSPAGALSTLWYGLNAYLNYTITLGDTGDIQDFITDDYSGEPGTLERLAGEPIEVIALDPSPTPSPLPSYTDIDGDLLNEATFPSVTALAYDKHGNLYFATADTTQNDGQGYIYVHCINDDSPRCDPADLNQVVPLAGARDGSCDYSHTLNTGTSGLVACLGVITDLNIDENDNIYFSQYLFDPDSLAANESLSTINVLCERASSGICDQANTQLNTKGIPNAIQEGDLLMLFGNVTTGPVVAGYHPTDPFIDGVSFSGWEPYDGWISKMDSDVVIHGFDVELNGDDINLFAATQMYDLNDRDEGTLVSACGFNSNTTDDNSPCEGAAVGASVDLETSKALTDVALNRHGNLFAVSPMNGRVYAYCTRITSVVDGFCDNVTTTDTLTGLTLAASNIENTTDSGDGGDYSDAYLMAGYKLALSKQYATDHASSFNDDNILVASFYRDDGANTKTGNTLRILCDPGAATPGGWCKGLSAGAVHTLAGTDGRSGTGASAADSANSIAFGSIYAVAYDPYKNIVFGSSWATNYFWPVSLYSGTSTIPSFDNSIYRLRLRSETDDFGAKYVFTDSNAQSSYYCLSLKAQVECGLQYFTHDHDSDSDTADQAEYVNTCTCTLLPSDGNPEGYWRGTNSSADCM